MTPATRPSPPSTALAQPWLLRPAPRRPSRRPSAALRAASRVETTGPRWWLALQAAFSVAALVGANAGPWPLTLGLAALVVVICGGGDLPAWMGQPGWLGVSATSAGLATGLALAGAPGSPIAALALVSAASTRAAWRPGHPGGQRLRRGHVAHALRQLQQRAAAKVAHALLLGACGLAQACHSFIA